MHDFLSPRRAKPQPTRIFLANSFLGNISLDGTHRDTKYRTLVELYKKDGAKDDDTNATDVSESEQQITITATSPSAETASARRRFSSGPGRSNKTNKKGKANVKRSDSLYSRKSGQSSSRSSSSSSARSASVDSFVEDMNEKGVAFSRTGSASVSYRKNLVGKSSSKSSKHALSTEDDTEENTVSASRSAKQNLRKGRRSSSTSMSKAAVKLDSLDVRREKVLRTVSASSNESHGLRAGFLRSGSASPGLPGVTRMSSSPPDFDDVEIINDEVMEEPVEMSLMEMLAAPGEILDSHRGVITEKKELLFTANRTSQLPFALSSYISKYKAQQVDEEIVEKRELPPRTFIQRMTARLSRINSAGSMESGKTGRSESPNPMSSLPSNRPSTGNDAARRPWQWPRKSRPPVHSPMVLSHQTIRPRRLSATHSIHIDTEAEALENLLGIKLSSDPEDELSYENLLVPLVWNVDYIGDLTPEEAKNLLNTGEIVVMSKHMNSLEDNYAYGKMMQRREREQSSSDQRTRYLSMCSTITENSCSMEPNSDQKEFAQDGYRPGILEDPEWETAVRRTNLYFDSYFSSIIANDLEPAKNKQALNELFRGKFPHIQLTFSKFKSIKRDMLKACTEQELQLDLAVVALSYVYYEKLVLKGFVNKPNRKILAGVCVSLAAKMSDLLKEEHKDLYASLQSQLRVEKDELHAFEFAATVALGFNLHVPVRYVRYHYDLLIRQAVELPALYAIPLHEPESCTRPRLNFNMTIRPITIRQISWRSGHPRSGQNGRKHKVNAKLAQTKRKPYLLL